MNKLVEILNSGTTYYIISSVLAVFVLAGIFLMSKVKRAKVGNIISAVAVLIAVIVTLIKFEIIPTKDNAWFMLVVFGGLLIGTTIGLLLTFKTKMIQMPQLIALLNGLGGLASLIVGTYVVILRQDPNMSTGNYHFNRITAIIAVVVGGFTLVGSLIAAGKLHRIIPQKPIKLKYHSIFSVVTIIVQIGMAIGYFFVSNSLVGYMFIIAIVLLSFVYGFLFTITIGGADMPIAISLLNSLSGVAGAISGLAINDVLLVSVGAIVGASGLLLTQIMCKNMNRSLTEILLGKTTVDSSKPQPQTQVEFDEEGEKEEIDFKEVAKEAKNIVIVPGYGMAVAQAQHLLKDVADEFKNKGADVKYAIHPVAGRMPGHMNVLLVEANVDYEDLYEMDQLNDKFNEVDLVIVVGANDVVNPAAKTAVDTPIYNMPILNIEDAKHIFIFNFDLKPGYAGVDNPLYKKKKGVTLFLGNALDTLDVFLKDIK